MLHFFFLSLIFVFCMINGKTLNFITKYKCKLKQKQPFSKHIFDQVIEYFIALCYENFI